MLAFHLLRVILDGLFGVFVDLFVSEASRRATHDPKGLLKRPHNSSVGKLFIIGAFRCIHHFRSTGSVTEISQRNLKR